MFQLVSKSRTKFSFYSSRRTVFDTRKVEVKFLTKDKNYWFCNTCFARVTSHILACWFHPKSTTATTVPIVPLLISFSHVVYNTPSTNSKKLPPIRQIDFTNHKIKSTFFSKLKRRSSYSRKEIFTQSIGKFF